MVKTRSAISWIGVRELDVSACRWAEVGMNQSAAGRAAQRGRMIVEELGLTPEKSETHNFMGVTNRGPEMRSNL